MKEKKDKEKFINKYINTYSPVGLENAGQLVWLNEMKKYVDSKTRDSYGNAIATLVGKTELKNRPSVVLEAHADEISWIITQVQDDGFIRVTTHGGSDNMIAPSMDVVIHTFDNKQVPGVFGWSAVHTRSTRVVEGPAVDELWIDCGFSDKEEASRNGVKPGCIVTFDTKLKEMGDYYVGKSLDNKIGGYILTQVAKRIKKENLEFFFDVVFVNAVQEEVGLYGATMLAKKLNPTLALVHDVCHASDTPGMNKAKIGDIKCGKGPLISYTAQNHRKLNGMFIDIAEDEGIPYQVGVGSYGNDTMPFFKEGIPTNIISSPLRYMHTTVEMVHKKDVESAIRLYVEVLKNITPEYIANVYTP